MSDVWPYCKKLQKRRIRCGGNHDIKNCNTEAIEKCCNCNMNHKASSKECRFYQERQNILKVKTVQKITYAEAARKMKEPSMERPLQKSAKTSIRPKPKPGLTQVQPQQSSGHGTSIQQHQNPFNWDQFAAFMLKAGMMFVGKNYQENDVSGRISMMAEIMSECFQVSLNEKRTSSIFNKMMSTSVKPTDTE